MLRLTSMDAKTLRVPSSTSQRDRSVIDVRYAKGSGGLGLLDLGEKGVKESDTVSDVIWTAHRTDAVNVTSSQGLRVLRFIGLTPNGENDVTFFDAFSENTSMNIAFLWRSTGSVCWPNSHCFILFPADSANQRGFFRFLLPLPLFTFIVTLSGSSV